MAKTVRLIGPSQRAYAQKLAAEAPANWIAKFAPETRRDAQNRKLWPMLADIQKQVPGMELFTTEDIKLRMLNAMGAEMRFLPALEGQGIFPVGLKSSTLTVEQFSGLIELLYEFGARHGVKWTDPKERDG